MKNMDKRQKILIVDDSKFNTFGYQYAKDEWS